MSKAVLVVDMPSKCEDCCFCRGLNVCRLKQCIEREGITSIHTVDKQIMEETKPDWCPLKPIPKKKADGDSLKIAIENDCYDGTTEDKAYLNGVDRGYNACIDELLKGEEG